MEKRKALRDQAIRDLTTLPSLQVPLSAPMSAQEAPTAPPEPPPVSSVTEDDDAPQRPWRDLYNNSIHFERPKGRFELPGLWFLAPLALLAVAGISFESIFSSVEVTAHRSIGVDRFDSSLLWAGAASFCLLYFPKIEGREAETLWEPFVARKAQFIVLGVFAAALLGWQSFRETSQAVFFKPNKTSIYCDSDRHSERRNIAVMGGVVITKFKGKTPNGESVYCQECWNAEVADQH